MKSPKPLLDAVFDQQDPEDGQRFLRLIEELKVKVAAERVTHGILLHRWVDPTHIRVVVFEGTPAGKEAAEALLRQGFEEGPFLGASAEPELSDVVARVRSATAQLRMPESQGPLTQGIQDVSGQSRGPESAEPRGTGPIAGLGGEGTSRMPETPRTPGTAGTPGILGRPGMTGTPGMPRMPGTPGTLGTPGMPGTSGKPGAGPGPGALAGGSQGVAGPQAPTGPLPRPDSRPAPGAGIRPDPRKKPPTA